MKDGLKNKPRSETYNLIANAIGGMPLVRRGRFQASKVVNTQILGKCEFLNLLTLVKGRIWLAMIKTAKPDNRVQEIAASFVSKKLDSKLTSEVRPIGLRNVPSHGTSGDYGSGHFHGRGVCNGNRRHTARFTER